jgi:hypothetical protein
MTHGILALLGAAVVSLLVAAAPVPTHCTARGVLPDPKCTPGAVLANVKQADIKNTVCKPGWTATVRPSSTYTSNLKRKQMKQYGYTDSLAQHEEDHLIPLELAGSPTDPRNLWPEPEASPNPKDKVENELKRRVCAGQITLFQAQRKIAKDWTTALQ